MSSNEPVKNGYEVINETFHISLFRYCSFYQHGHRNIRCNERIYLNLQHQGQDFGHRIVFYSKDNTLFGIS